MKKVLLVIFCVIFLLITQFSSNFEKSALEIESIPKDFAFDGCSMFPDGNYGDCCLEHDKSYFFGGTWQARNKADIELAQCVQSKGGLLHTLLGPSMYVGVRIGGAPVFPTSYRWGFGRDIY